MNLQVLYRKHENLVDKIYKDLKKRRYNFQLIGRHVNYGVSYNKVIDEIDLVQYSHLNNDTHYFVLHEVKGSYKQTRKGIKQLRRAYKYLINNYPDKKIRVFCMLERGYYNDKIGKYYNTKWLTKKDLRIKN